jgi:hypothetical protein
LKAPKLRTLNSSMTIPGIVVTGIALLIGIWILIRLLPSE